MKKLISLILCFALCLCGFSACSKDDVDKYHITKDTHYSYVNESVDNAYKKLYSAVCSAESQVKFNTSLIDDVNQLFYTCCVFYPLVESIVVLYNNTGVEIKYKNDYDTHMKLIEQFEAEIDEIMKECRYSKVSTDEYIFNVYTYITGEFELDNSILTAFDTLLEGRGHNAAVNSLFEYLVLRGGGEASHIISSSATGIVSLVSFKGEYYYFNPAKEIENNSGTALKYFAMDNKRAPGDFTYTDSTAVESVSDDTFSQLDFSKSFTLDNSKVTVLLENSTDFVFTLD